MIARLALGFLVSLVSTLCQAQDLTLPAAARLLSNRTSALDSYDLPIGSYANGVIPVRKLEGRIERKTWRINGVSATTLQLLKPLSAQLTTLGYEIVFECKDSDCGGFDFRFGTEVVPAPDMHVDIRNYRFLSAIREPGRAISILLSRSGNAAYIQIISAVSLDQPTSNQPNPDQPGDVPGDVSRPITIPAGDVAAALASQGHVILNDLVFGSGAGALLAGSHDSLAQLATYMRSYPDQRIVLVGHTDSTGSLKTNIALSKQRAAAVKARLVQAFDVDPARIDAEGMGYLAPIASNFTRQGREENRRVEAIALPNN